MDQVKIIRHKLISLRFKRKLFFAKMSLRKDFCRRVCLKTTEVGELIRLLKIEQATRARVKLNIRESKECNYPI